LVRSRCLWVMEMRSISSHIHPNVSCSFRYLSLLWGVNVVLTWPQFVTTLTYVYLEI
jgi:hypothetical protein